MMLSRSMFSRVVLSFAGVGALALAAANCGGGDGDSGGAGTGGGGGTGGGAGTGGACDVPALFTAKSCAITGCHSSNMPAANFDMKTPGWETAMVGKAPPGGGPAATASLCSAMGKVYLAAGSQPATGLFLDKFKKNPGCGVQMPNLPLSELSASEVACVQAWANNLTKPK